MSLELDLSAEEFEFYHKYLKTQGALVTVSLDKSEVFIDGVNRGSFADTKAIFVTEWNLAVAAVAATATKESGVVYDSVTCSATNTDLLSVNSTVSNMGAVTGQTNVPIKFSNGNTLLIDDDADLLAFLGVWQPFRLANSIGYTYEEEA